VSDGQQALWSRTILDHGQPSGAAREVTSQAMSAIA
jgi:hypothetical protein